MKIKTIKFHPGQAVAVNAYLNIMTNACWVVYSHGTPDLMKNTFFKDVIDLSNDKMADKVGLANDIQDEISAKYQGRQGAYLEGDFKDVDMLDKYVWFVHIHNSAIELVHDLLSFSSTDLTIIK